MLSKPFARTFVPGRPAVPEVLAREAYTYCTTPAGYTSVRVCVPPNTYFSASLGTIVTVPGYCYTERRPNPGSQEIVCRDIPAVEGAPAQPAIRPRFDTAPVIGWDAGANSVQVLSGNCEAVWTMGVVAGAYIGLTSEREDVVDPLLLSHAILFHQKAGRPYFRLVEAGKAVSADARYSNDDEFRIRRVGSEVQYWHGEVMIAVSAVPSTGDVSVGSRLYASGDAVPTGTVGDSDLPAVVVYEFEDTVPPGGGLDWGSDGFSLLAGDYLVSELEGAPGVMCAVMDTVEMFPVVVIPSGALLEPFTVEQDSTFRVLAATDSDSPAPVHVVISKVGG